MYYVIVISSHLHNSARLREVMIIFTSTFYFIQQQHTDNFSSVFSHSLSFHGQIHSAVGSRSSCLCTSVLKLVLIL